MSIANVANILTKRIVASGTNPRKEFSQADEADLVASIKEKGIMYPLTVRRSGPKAFEIVDGERRYRAAKRLKLGEVPCIVVAMTDEEAIDAQMISHLQRKNISPIEEAQIFALLVNKKKKTIAQVAAASGKNPAYVHQTMELLRMAREARILLEEKVITVDHARILARMTDDDQKRALEFLIDEDYEEGNKFAKPIETFRNWVKDEVSFNLSNAPWDKKDGELIPGVPACTLCPKNSAFNTTLFSEDQGKGVCQDRHCFNAKLAAYKDQEHKRARAEEKLPFLLITVREFVSPDDPMKVDGLKSAGRFKVIKEKTKCENTKRAQWVDGPDKGKRVLVCNYSKCPKHFPEGAKRAKASKRSGGPDDYFSPENQAKRKKAEAERERKAVLELECRDAIFVEAVKMMPKVLDSPTLKWIIKTWMRGHRFESEQFMARRRSITPGQLKKDFLGIVDRATDAELMVILHEIATDDMLQRWQQESTRAIADNLASRYGIDQKMVRQAVNERMQGKKEEPEKKALK